MRQGFHVICDKPLASNLADALTLRELARQSGKLFCLTHNYTGYPLVRHARAMVAAVSGLSPVIITVLIPICRI